jgi:hypothetical protein
MTTLSAEEIVYDIDVDDAQHAVSYALALPGTATKTALQLPAGMSFEEWQQVGEQLQHAQRAVMWWLGDWWAFGERRYGEEASQASDLPSAKTLSNAASVCMRINPSRRRESLSFSHHADVAYLGADIADRLLDLAEEHDWTRTELRKQIRIVLGKEGSSKADLVKLVMELMDQLNEDRHQLSTQSLGALRDLKGLLDEVLHEESA